MNAAPAMADHPIQPRPIPARTVKTRRVDFAYPTGDELPKHFMNGDPVMSHVVAVLSSLFPEGEDFFVRTVRNYRDQISDPELRKQVAGFIGQEAMHGREHRDFNDRLARMGYPTRLIDTGTGISLKIGERILPKPVQLAITAALEHYTATLAEVLMADEAARAKFGVDEIRSLLLWHALEESEHKSVAFDVYETVSGNRRIRTTVMNLTTLGFLGATVGLTLLSLLGDLDTYRHPRRVLAGLRRIRQSPWLTPEVRARIRDYNRKGFHPDDHDATELGERWRAELFGAQGTLADRVKTAS